MDSARLSLSDWPLRGRFAPPCHLLFIINRRWHYILWWKWTLHLCLNLYMIKHEYLLIGSERFDSISILFYYVVPWYVSLSFLKLHDENHDWCEFIFNFLFLIVWFRILACWLKISRYFILCLDIEHNKTFHNHKIFRSFYFSHNSARFCIYT